MDTQKMELIKKDQIKNYKTRSLHLYHSLTITSKAN